MLMHRLREGLTQNRLLLLTVGAFLGLYCVAAYVLVSRGLDFVANKVPLLGPLLMERMIYLLFFFFFLMLVISNATITGMSLYRRKDMEWQVALPVPYRSLVLWKTLEGMMLASWGLLILSAPILVALGRVFNGGPVFYLAGTLALICLVTIAANLSTWVLLLLVRYARRWWWRPMAALAAFALATALYRFLTFDPEDLKARDIVANLHEVLKHTELCMHPLLPSSWVAEALFASGRGLDRQLLFSLLSLLANALFGFVITARLGSSFFYPGWQRVMTAAPQIRQRSAASVWFRHPKLGAPNPLLQRILGLDRAGFAMLLKDIRTFLREPTQWGQCALIFGLLLMYTANLRRLGYDLQNPMWTLIISHLNLLVCSLALSTLTTRFIFPQFSMEGQRIWILGLSPMPLNRLLALKLRLSGSVMGLLTTGLVLISSLSLELPWQRTIYFCATVMMLSYGLNALALALGALLPNFREPNPARVVSGFGGTLCLIGSFLYIIGGSLALAIPAAMSWQASTTGRPISAELAMQRDLLSLGAVALLTLLFGGLPYWIAKNRTKNLDYLGKL